MPLQWQKHSHKQQCHYRAPRQNQHRIWNGNTKGLWKRTTIDVVVAETVRGIQRRAKRIAAPRRLTAVTLAPGITQAVIDRFGFPGRTVEEAIALIPARTTGATGRSLP